jgi:hypothetical protein
MSVAEIDGNDVEPLRQLAVADHLSVLLGAGASATSGLPDWDTLAATLLVKSGVIPDENTAKEFLARQDPALAAEAAKAASGAKWPVFLRDALYGADREDEIKPTALHLGAAWLAIDRKPSDVHLFTLNFDSLLESAMFEYVGAGQVFSRAAGNPRGRSDQYEIHHLHGHLPIEGKEAPGVILTLSEFTEINRHPHPWQVAELQNALSKGPLLLAGTSYRDADIRQWIHNLLHDSSFQPAGPVVVLLAREGLGLNRLVFEQVKHAIIEQWDAIGVAAVATHDYADAAQLFAEMPWLSHEDYLPPAQRAKNLWKAHEASFGALQHEHADQLRLDVERLRKYLGDQANLTLWIPDGKGRVVRWAANDRLYFRAKDLRRIVPGFDSKWVVGQALGLDGTVVRELEDPATGRWRSVVAKPVSVNLTGGPAFSGAAISSATPLRRIDLDVDGWTKEIDRIAEEWGNRLSGITNA